MTARYRAGSGSGWTLSLCRRGGVAWTECAVLWCCRWKWWLLRWRTSWLEGCGGTRPGRRDFYCLHTPTPRILALWREVRTRAGRATPGTPCDPANQAHLGQAADKRCRSNSDAPQSEWEWLQLAFLLSIPKVAMRVLRSLLSSLVNQ